MKAYMVQSCKDHCELPTDEQNYLYNIDDEDFTSKKSAKQFIKEETESFNKLFETHYGEQFLFGDIIEGRRFCPHCGAFFWAGEECEC